MTDATRINVVELTVSELSNALKRTIEDGFGYVRVRGELGNVKYHTSGHVYLDLASATITNLKSAIDTASGGTSTLVGGAFT